MAKRPSLLGAGREAAAATQTRTPEAPTVRAKEPPASKVTMRAPAAKQRRYAAAAASESATITVVPAEQAAPARQPVPAKAAAPESSAIAWSFRVDPAGSTSLVTTVNTALMGEAGALYREMMSFADARLQHTVKTAEALGRCENPAEALQTQADYALTSMTECATASMKFFDLATGIARKSWASLWSVARRDGG
jgi:hypothetical protein